jgi:hypothetical protein
MPNPLLRQLRSMQNRAGAWRLCRRMRCRNPVIVYQMGKVGSSTVVHTLRALDQGAPVLHCHTLIEARVSEAVANHRRQRSHAVPRHLLEAAYTIRALRAGTFPCRVITLAREPVARAISFAFEDWRRQASQALRDEQLDFSAMQDAISNLLSQSGGHADPSRWFDGELREVFGIDVFSGPFDHERGFQVLDNGPVSVLVLRLEDLNRSLPVALGEFLGLDPGAIQISPANVGSEKWYAGSLAEMKSRFRLPRSVLERIYATRYAQHFYAPEAQALIGRWAA